MVEYIKEIRDFGLTFSRFNLIFKQICSRYFQDVIEKDKSL